MLFWREYWWGYVMEPGTDKQDSLKEEHTYKGILWLKEKYEQFRLFADKRYEQAREELARVEKKYQDLLAAPPAEAGGVILDEKNKQIAQLQYQLQEKEDLIEELKGQLTAGRQKIEELVAKLHESGEQLLSIHRELDRSMRPAGETGPAV
jgi:DNA-binding PucR family transcriptional regulator